MQRATPLRRLTLCLCVAWPCLSVVVQAGEAETPASTRAWTSITDNRSKDVFRVLKEDVTDRNERLARATAYLDLQPTTDGNMRQAETEFADLAKGNDEIAMQAAYLQARLYQLHYQNHDYAKAADLFEQLARRAPESHWAQLGLVKLAMIQLYTPVGGDDGARRLTAAEAVLARIKEMPLRRDLELQIGQAGIMLKQPLSRVIPHLVEADRIGGLTGTAAEDLLVQLGELSLRNGQVVQAKAYFERYLKEYPINLRAYGVQRRLEEIAARASDDKKGGS